MKQQKTAVLFRRFTIFIALITLALFAMPGILQAAGLDLAQVTQDTSPIRYPTTVIVTSSANPSQQGETVTYTFQVTSAAGGIPTGIVAFQYPGVYPPAVFPLDANGIATYAVDYYGPGTVTFDCIYDGDANFAPSSSTYSQVISEPPITHLTARVEGDMSFGQFVRFYAEYNANPTNFMIDFGDGTVSPIDSFQLYFGVYHQYPYWGEYTATITASNTTSLITTTVPVTIMQPDSLPTYINLTANAEPSETGKPVAITAQLLTNPPVTFPSFIVFRNNDNGEIYSVTLTNNIGVYTTTFFNPGVYSITADYLGEGIYGPSSATLNHTVNRPITPTTMTIAATPNPCMIGEYVTLQVNLTGDNGTPDGNIVFHLPDGDYTRPLVNGSASLETAFYAMGYASISVEYLGSDNYGPHTEQYQQTTKIPTMLNLWSDGPDTYQVGQPITYTAHFTSPENLPGGQIVFQVNGVPYTRTFPSSYWAKDADIPFVFVFPEAGIYTVTASYPGGEFQFPSTAPESVIRTVVEPVTPTQITLTADLEPSVAMEKVTFSVDVTSDSGIPTGMVVIYNGNRAVFTHTLVNGHTDFAFAFGPATANYTISAHYYGADLYKSSDVSITHAVLDKISPSGVALTFEPETPVVGEVTTLTAHITGTASVPQGFVVIMINNNYSPLLPVIDGQAVYTTVFPYPNQFSIYTSYRGDRFYNGYSFPFTFKYATTSSYTSMGMTPTTSLIGQRVDFTASVTAANNWIPTGYYIHFNVTKGTESFKIWGSYENGRGWTNYTFEKPGIYTITAEYPDNAGFNRSVSTPIIYTVISTPTVTTVSSSANPAKIGDVVTYTFNVTAATSTPSGYLKLYYNTNFPWAYTYVGLQNGQGVYTTTYNEIGTTHIRAEYIPGEPGYEASSAELNQIVQDTTSLAVVTSPSPSLPREMVTITATVTAAHGTLPTGSLYYYVNGKAYTQTLTNGQVVFTTTFQKKGAYLVMAAYPGDTYYTPSAALVLHQVKKNK